jgi:hypothetical protein
VGGDFCCPAGTNCVDNVGACRTEFPIEVFFMIETPLKTPGLETVPGICPTMFPCISISKLSY